MEEFTRKALEEIKMLNNNSLNMRLPLEEKITSPWDLFLILDLLRKESKEGIHAKEDFIKEEFSIVKGALYAGKGASIGSFAKIVGPVILGEGAQICDYGYILGPAIIGSRARISAQVARSIILSGTQAVHRDTYIGDSIVGRDCNFGAGTITGNVRFDGKSPMLAYGEKNYEPGRERLGAIIEHKVKLGINSNLKPGTYISAGELWIGNNKYEGKKRNN